MKISELASRIADKVISVQWTLPNEERKQRLAELIAAELATELKPLVEEHIMQLAGISTAEPTASQRATLRKPSTPHAERRRYEPVTA